MFVCSNRSLHLYAIAYSMFTSSDKLLQMSTLILLWGMSVEFVNYPSFKQVITRLKQLHSSIVFLQETHVFKDELLKVRRRWRGQVKASCFSSHSRGVMVLIHKFVPFQVENIITDTAVR